MNAESTSLTGRLMKVVRFDASEETAWVRLLDGRTASFDAHYLDTLAAGDILLVDDDGQPQPAPSTLWVEPTAVGVVRRVEPDGSVLLDTGSRIIAVRNELAVLVAVDNTVEFNDGEGVVRVVSQTPIRSGDFGLDTADIRREFLVPRTAGGARFEDFGGFPDVVARARELIETQINQRDRLRSIGARPVKGVLFAGPPGTGKTHLARIIAQEADAEFFLVNGLRSSVSGSATPRAPCDACSRPPATAPQVDRSSSSTRSIVSRNAGLQRRTNSRSVLWPSCSP